VQIDIRYNNKTQSQELTSCTYQVFYIFISIIWWPTSILTTYWHDDFCYSYIQAFSQWNLSINLSIIDSLRWRKKTKYYEILLNTTDKWYIQVHISSGQAWIIYNLALALHVTLDNINKSIISLTIATEIRISHAKFNATIAPGYFSILNFLSILYFSFLFSAYSVTSRNTRWSKSQ